MSFPLDYHGEIKWKKNAEGTPEQVQERFLKNIDVELHHNSGNNIRYIDNTITFSGGIRWLRFNYNATACITTGLVEIYPADDGFLISYYLNFMQMFVLDCISAFICLFPFLLFVFVTKPSIFIFTVALAWIVFIGAFKICIDYLSTIFRFRILLKRALKKM